MERDAPNDVIDGERGRDFRLQGLRGFVYRIVRNNSIFNLIAFIIVTFSFFSLRGLLTDDQTETGNCVAVNRDNATSLGPLLA